MTDRNNSIPLISTPTIPTRRASSYLITPVHSTVHDPSYPLPPIQTTRRVNPPRLQPPPTNTTDPHPPPQTKRHTPFTPNQIPSAHIDKPSHFFPPRIDQPAPAEPNQATNPNVPYQFHPTQLLMTNRIGSMPFPYEISPLLR